MAEERDVKLASLLLGTLALVAQVAAAPVPAPPIATEGHLRGADGVRLFYRKMGNGREAIVYLHGGPGSNFRGQDDFMAPLGEGRTLIVYDQRGSGLSDVVTDPARLGAEDHVRDLEALRAHFGFERMTLMGLSWGAGLAALYADRHPARVQDLLLLLPIPPARAPFWDQRMAALAALKGPVAASRRGEILAALGGAPDSELPSLCRELSDDTFRLYFAEPTPEKLAHAARRCDIPPAAFRNRPVVEKAVLASLGSWDFRPLLGRIRARTLVLEGERTNVPLEPTREWAAAMPNARLLLIPGAGHEFFVDQPAAFLDAAVEFLAGRWPKDAQPVGKPGTP